MVHISPVKWMVCPANGLTAGHEPASAQVFRVEGRQRQDPASEAGEQCGEAVMNGSAAAVAYLILAVFLGGIAIGVVAMVAIAVRKEDQLYSLSGAAPGAAARGARRLTGFGGAGAHVLPRGRGR